MNERELLVDSLSRLNKAGLDYYLTGSMASNYWGIPRTTHDLDFVLCLTPSSVDLVVALFTGDYYIDAQAVRGAFGPPWQFNAIDSRSALKVDFWLPKSAPFDAEMLKRRVRVTMFGTPAWVASPEDVIVHKLLWNKISPSERQLKDAAGVFEVQRGRLDIEYIRSWADQLALRIESEKLLSGEIRPKNT